MSIKSLSTRYLTNSFLLLNNVLFFIQYIVLSWYNRISIDDFYFLANVKKYGIIQGTIVEYSSWSSRWLSVLLNQFILTFYEYKYFLFLFQLFLFGLFLFGVSRFLNAIKFRLKESIRFSYPEIINISCFVISAFFYATIKIDETWFWLCSSCTYLMSMIMIFILISTIVSISNTWFNIFLLCISSLYIGASSEPFALFLLLTFSIALILIYQKHKLFSSDIINQKNLIAGFVLCLIAFIIMFLGEGNRIREQYFLKINLLETFLLNIKTTGMIIILRLPGIMIYALIFTFPLYFSGRKYWECFSKENILRRIVFSVVVFFTLIFVYQFPITFVTQDIGAYRALFPVTLFALFWSGWLWFIIGRLKDFLHQKNVLITLFLIAFLINAYSLFNQIRIVSKYSVAYDARIEKLLENRNSKISIALDPLPFSGHLYSAEISMDTNYFSNKQLRMGLELKATPFLEGK